MDSMVSPCSSYTKLRFRSVIKFRPTVICSYHLVGAGLALPRSFQFFQSLRSFHRPPCSLDRLFLEESIVGLINWFGDQREGNRARFSSNTEASSDQVAKITGLANSPTLFSIFTSQRLALDLIRSRLNHQRPTWLTVRLRSKITSLTALLFSTVQDSPNFFHHRTRVASRA